MEIVDFKHLESITAGEPLQEWGQQSIQVVKTKLAAKPHGDLERWLTAVNQLPHVAANEVQLNADAITTASTLTVETQAEIKQALSGLQPWRKGPFDLHGIFVDSEWRSNLKWDRLVPHITPLQNRRVLDIGSGNGYYLWRMLGEGAACAIGIDPTLLLAVQFQAVRHFVGHDLPAAVLPLGIEDLPLAEVFDTVFSMGVIYHRRDPQEHIEQLKSLLRPGGELVLETLVIESNKQDVLHPQERYAQMRNVWAIPSPDLLTQWLSDCGLQNVRIVDISATTTEEQRSTEWMRFHSLQDFLDPDDVSKTIEGYPAPVRAIVTAQKSAD